MVASVAVHIGIFPLVREMYPNEACYLIRKTYFVPVFLFVVQDVDQIVPQLQ